MRHFIFNFYTIFPLTTAVGCSIYSRRSKDQTPMTYQGLFSLVLSGERNAASQRCDALVDMSKHKVAPLNQQTQRIEGLNSKSFKLNGGSQSLKAAEKQLNDMAVLPKKKEKPLKIVRYFLEEPLIKVDEESDSEEDYIWQDTIFVRYFESSVQLQEQVDEVVEEDDPIDNIIELHKAQIQHNLHSRREFLKLQYAEIKRLQKFKKQEDRIANIIGPLKQHNDEELKVDEIIPNDEQRASIKQKGLRERPIEVIVDGNKPSLKATLASYIRALEVEGDEPTISLLCPRLDRSLILKCMRGFKKIRAFNDYLAQQSEFFLDWYNRFTDLKDTNAQPLAFKTLYKRYDPIDCQKVAHTYTLVTEAFSKCKNFKLLKKQLTEEVEAALGIPQGQFRCLGGGGDSRFDIGSAMYTFGGDDPCFAYVPSMQGARTEDCVLQCISAACAYICKNVPKPPLLLAARLSQYAIREGEKNFLFKVNKYDSLKKLAIRQITELGLFQDYRTEIRNLAKKAKIPWDQNQFTRQLQDPVNHPITPEQAHVFILALNVFTTSGMGTPYVEGTPYIQVIQSTEHIKPYVSKAVLKGPNSNNKGGPEIVNVKGDIYHCMVLLPEYGQEWAAVDPDSWCSYVALNTWIKDIDDLYEPTFRDYVEDERSDYIKTNITSVAVHEIPLWLIDLRNNVGECPELHFITDGFSIGKAVIYSVIYSSNWEGLKTKTAKNFLVHHQGKGAHGGGYGFVKAFNYNAFKDSNQPGQFAYLEVLAEHVPNKAKAEKKFRATEMTPEPETKEKFVHTPTCSTDTLKEGSKNAQLAEKVQEYLEKNDLVDEFPAEHIHTIGLYNRLDLSNEKPFVNYNLNGLPNPLPSGTVVQDELSIYNDLHLMRDQRKIPKIPSLFQVSQVYLIITLLLTLLVDDPSSYIIFTDNVRLLEDIFTIMRKKKTSPTIVELDQLRVQGTQLTKKCFALLSTDLNSPRVPFRDNLLPEFQRYLRVIPTYYISPVFKFKSDFISDLGAGQGTISTYDSMTLNPKRGFQYHYSMYGTKIQKKFFPLLTENMHQNQSRDTYYYSKIDLDLSIVNQINITENGYVKLTLYKIEISAPSSLGQITLGVPIANWVNGPTFPLPDVFVRTYNTIVPNDAIYEQQDKNLDVIINPDATNSMISSLAINDSDCMTTKAALNAIRSSMAQSNTRKASALSMVNLYNLAGRCAHLVSHMKSDLDQGLGGVRSCYSLTTILTFGIPIFILFTSLGLIMDDKYYSLFSVFWKLSFYLVISPILDESNPVVACLHFVFLVYSLKRVGFRPKRQTLGVMSFSVPIQLCVCYLIYHGAYATQCDTFKNYIFQMIQTHGSLDLLNIVSTWKFFHNQVHVNETVGFLYSILSGLFKGSLDVAKSFSGQAAQTTLLAADSIIISPTRLVITESLQLLSYIFRELVIQAVSTVLSLVCKAFREKIVEIPTEIAFVKWCFFIMLAVRPLGIGEWFYTESVWLYAFSIALHLSHFGTDSERFVFLSSLQPRHVPVLQLCVENLMSFAIKFVLLKTDFLTTLSSPFIKQIQGWVRVYNIAFTIPVVHFITNQVVAPFCGWQPVRYLAKPNPFTGENGILENLKSSYHQIKGKMNETIKNIKIPIQTPICKEQEQEQFIGPEQLIQPDLPVKKKTRLSYKHRQNQSRQRQPCREEPDLQPRINSSSKFQVNGVLKGDDVFKWIEVPVDEEQPKLTFKLRTIRKFTVNLFTKIVQFMSPRDPLGNPSIEKEGKVDSNFEFKEKMRYNNEKVSIKPEARSQMTTLIGRTFHNIQTSIYATGLFKGGRQVICEAGQTVNNKMHAMLTRSGGTTAYPTASALEDLKKTVKCSSKHFHEEVLTNNYQPSAEQCWAKCAGKKKALYRSTWSRMQEDTKNVQMFLTLIQKKGELHPKVFSTEEYCHLHSCRKLDCRNCAKILFQKARAVYTPTDEFLVLAVIINHIFMNSLPPVHPEACVGLDGNQLKEKLTEGYQRVCAGAIFAEFIRKGREAVAILCGDGRSHDAHQHVSLQEIVDKQYICPVLAFVLANSPIPYQYFQPGKEVAYQPFRKVIFTLCGKDIKLFDAIMNIVTSGDPLKTTFGNTIRVINYLQTVKNRALNRYFNGIDSGDVFEGTQWQKDRIVFFVAGDDFIIFCDDALRQDLEDSLNHYYLIGEEPEEYIEHGFGQVLKFLNISYTTGTFLSKCIMIDPWQKTVVTSRDALRVLLTGNVSSKLAAAKLTPSEFNYGIHQQLKEQVGNMELFENFLKYRETVLPMTEHNIEFDNEYRYKGHKNSASVPTDLFETYYGFNAARLLQGATNAPEFIDAMQYLDG